MAVQLISVKCPDCGAVLNVEPNQEQAFCEYCGAKVLIYDENKIKENESTKTEKIEEEIETEQKRKEEIEKRKLLKTKISATLLGVSTLMLVLICIFGLKTNSFFSFLMVAVGIGSFAGFICSLAMSVNLANAGEICTVPSVVSDFEKRNYKMVEEIFKCAGFTNIKCIPVHDLTLGLLRKPDMVESITINGKNAVSGGKKCLSNALVIISYHSFSKK